MLDVEAGLVDPELAGNRAMLHIEEQVAEAVASQRESDASRLQMMADELVDDAPPRGGPNDQAKRNLAAQLRICARRIQLER